MSNLPGNLEVENPWDFVVADAVVDDVFFCLSLDLYFYVLPDPSATSKRSNPQLTSQQFTLVKKRSS